jgi:NADH dehydrogenase (ubiquinone) 1 alpha subcomplex subunit 5
MRASARLLTRYLEAGRPTGLTGLLTHPAPRAALLSIYGTTLDKLKAIPETSVYRQSVEALTKHRMAIVEGMVPPPRTSEGKTASSTDADLTADQ